MNNDRRHWMLATGATLVTTGCAVDQQRSATATLASSGSGKSRQELIRDVTNAELAFAKTIVDRDHAAFLTFIAPEAIFLNGGNPLRGRQAIGDFWKRFYTGPNPPFTWKPDLVEVLDSGILAQSVGPVTNPQGVVTMRFYSTWRLDADQRWRVVFDDGYSTCVKT